MSVALRRGARFGQILPLSGELSGRSRVERANRSSGNGNSTFGFGNSKAAGPGLPGPTARRSESALRTRNGSPCLVEHEQS